MTEYGRLKGEFEKQSAIISGNLDQKMQEQEVCIRTIEV